jgi:hypothetical protein
VRSRDVPPDDAIDGSERGWPRANKNGGARIHVRTGLRIKIHDFWEYLQGFSRFLGHLGVPDLQDVPIPRAQLDQNPLEKSRSDRTKKQAEIAISAESAGLEAWPKRVAL